MSRAHRIKPARSRLRVVEGSLSLALLICVIAGPAVAQHPSGHEGHGGHEHMSMPAGDDAVTPQMQAKMLADKEESEFNHHLAGLFVMLAGLFILAQGGLVTRWPALKYAWPACLIASGVFLLVWSDTELWPFGHHAWLDTLRRNREVLQHKTYAVLLLVMGAIESLRARGHLRAAWSGWVFPVVAIAGSVLLLFHQHEAGAHGPHHVELMARIQSQHLSYSLAGVSVGLTKALSDVETPWQRVLQKLWPSLMILLGILLAFYRE